MPVRKHPIFSQILIFFLVSSGFSQSVYAKSIYAITKHSNSTLTAYDINDTQIDYQTALDVHWGSGAVGLALDPATSTLFITYDGANKIEMVYANTMEEIKYIGTTEELAGVVFDETKQKLYAVSREDTKLYVYLWNPASKSLTLEDGTYKVLTNLSKPPGAFGLALDENKEHLFVTDKTNAVKYYDTSDPDFGYLGSVPIVVNVNRKAVGIAFYNDDQGNKYLYTGAYVHSGVHDFLVRTDINDINNPTSVEKNIGSSVIGITVDQDTGLVYVTNTNNNIEVFDNSTFPSDPCYIEDADISGPADIVVGYKPRVFILVKDNNDPNNDCVQPWNSVHENYLVYDICYDANGLADTNVVITDYLAVRDDGHPLVSYYSSDPCGTYDANEHTVTWDINELDANDSNCIKLTVKVTGWATSRYTIKNVVAMEGDTYYNEATEDVNVCAGTGEIIYVDKDANGLNDGSSWDDAYTVLQDAFTAACNDFNVGAIWVAAKTYKPTWDAENMTWYETFELIEGVALFGHFGGIGTYETKTTQRKFSDPNNETILDGLIGENSWEAVLNVVTAKGIENAIVDGFTIQNSINGSGMLLDSANISVVNCKFKNNRIKGIACINQSSPDIHNCLFMDNFPNGIYSAYSWSCISNCIFDGNNSTAYGLNSGESNVGITDCVFKNHTNDGIKAFGGELFVTNCYFEGNFEGNNDYGLWLQDANLSMDNSVIANSGYDGLYMKQDCALTLTNSVIRYSGEDGISLNSNTAETTIKNNWIHNSGGAGIYFNNQDGVPLVRNNTIYDNSTYGIESGSADPNIVNCIIYGNDTGDLGGSFSDVNYCCLQSDHGGEGNIVADPCFINPTDPNDLHIDVNSHCKDAGDPNVDYGDETDIDGEARVKYGRVDMGADEYYWSPADLNRDEIVNFIDYCEFALAWGTAAGEPNYNEKCDLADNNSIDYNDLDLFCEDWLWEAGWGDTQWMMCMGGGGFGPGSSELMIPDAVQSLKAMPERLAAKSRKFYEVTPATTIAARQATSEVNIKEILEWLDGFWLDGALQEVMSKDEYLEFRKAIEESLKQN